MHVKKRTRFTTKKKISTLFFSFLLLLFIAGEALFLFSGTQVNNARVSKTLTPISKSQIITYADLMVSKCKTAPYRPSCYDKEIPKLMSQISMLDTFKVTSVVQDKDHAYFYCHVLGHDLGAREVDKDQSRWKDTAAMCPSDMCSNGCIHGVFQEHFREAQTTTVLSDAQVAKIIPQLDDICEARQTWHPTGLQQASCYHALGHLTMYITNAQISKALPICDRLAKRSDGRDYRHLCYDGVFMQIFQPLAPEDFALIKGKEVTLEHHLAFCNQYTGEQRGSCISEGWPLYKDTILTGDGLYRFCSQEEPAEQQRCFWGMIYVVTPRLDFNVDKIVNFCQKVRGISEGECAAQAASRMIETDYRNVQKSLAVCTAVAPVDPQNACYKELLLFSTYNFHKGSESFYALCNGLPGDWKTRCLKPS